MKKNIYWILINFNNCDDIHKLISLYENNCDFIIVDNSHNYINYNNESIIIPETNLGYIGGFKYALNFLNDHSISKCIFSNSDIKIIDGFNKIFEINKDISNVIVPRIISPNGEQNPHLVKRQKKKYWVLRYVSSKNPVLWFLWTFLANFRKKVNKKLNKSSNLNYQKIYSGHGAFLMFNNIDFSKFKISSHNFLYGEEIHFAEYFKMNNIPVLFDPKIIIHHNEHVSTSKLNNNFRRILFNDSYKSILSKYY
tara:strand:+ start:531 stop:1289 length:759 start_codon:yes stop_codon:yes gene_type:complete